MKEFFLVSVLLLSASVVSGGPGQKRDCPTCKLCPLHDKGCCFNYDMKMIPNGGSYDPNACDKSNGGPVTRKNEDREHHKNYVSCANFTCVDGDIKKKYYCPLGWDAMGAGCYFVGPKKMHYQDAKIYCQDKGPSVQLAQLETKEKAWTLMKDIKKAMPEIDGDMEGVFWLGAAMYWDNKQYWNQPPWTLLITDGYSAFKNQPKDKDRVAAFAVENHVLDKYWYYKDEWHLAYPLCQKMQCSKPTTCSYKGKEYKCGEVMWRDPKCECSWIECGYDGVIKAVQKKKPCCVYDGEVYGDGDDVLIDKCSKMVCKKGKLVSFPYCGSNGAAGVHWTPLTYNGSSSCYYFIRDPKTYEEASRFCAKYDSKLVEITSEGENEAVENWLINMNLHTHQKGAEFWLGGRADLCDNGKLGHFHWTSAESRKLPVEAVYEDFCDNKPCKDTSAHCLYSVCTKEKDKNYFCWANAACKEQKYFVCEKCASCEQIYKNVCYRYGYPGQPYMDGSLVDAGHIRSHGYGGSCYEQHCENGKIIQRSFVCGDEYKQVTPEIRIKPAKQAADEKVERDNKDQELPAESILNKSF